MNIIVKFKILNDFNTTYKNVTFNNLGIYIFI